MINHLLNLSFAKLGGEDVAPDEKKYADFTVWYIRPDGTLYSIVNNGDFVNECKQRVCSEMKDKLTDAEELIEGILKESQPPCMHRFSRYQDIKLTSIGALKWRGNLPPDNEVSKEAATTWFNRAGLKDWLDNAPSKGKLSAELHEILGKPTKRKKAIVRDFFCGPTSDSFWHWLEANAEKERITASSILAQKFM